MYAPAENQPLIESLDFISRQSGLEFQQLSESLFVIIKLVATTDRICGFIVNGENNEHLAGATITNGTRSAVSDQFGFFSIEQISKYSQFTVQYVGFETRHLSPEDFNEGCVKVTIQPSISPLEEVVILNYLARGIDRNIDGSLEVRPKNQQLLPGMTEPDVLFTIQALPGIQSADETVSNINIRGGTHDQNLILWEGIKMYQSGHFFGLISAFNPQFNDQVTITKNGTSASYGQGVSGIISMRSDETNDPQKISGSAGIGLNMINGDVNLRIPISQKTRFKISSRRAITDIIRTPTFDRYFERAFENTDVLSLNPSGNVINTDDKFYFYDISTRLTHEFSERSRLAINVLNITNKLDFEETEITNTVTNSRTSSLEQQSLAAGIDYKKAWNANISTSISSSLSKYNLDAVNFDLPNDQRLIQKNEVLDLNVKASSQIKIGKSNFKVGYELNETGVQNLEDINNPDFRRLLKDVIITHSGFIENSFSYNNTKARIGLRGNLYTKNLNEKILEPRFSLSQKITPELTLEVNGEMKSQATVQIIDLQTDFLGVEKRRWVLANETDIPLIRSEHLSLGGHFKKNGLLVSVEAYTKEIDGIITSSQGFLNQFELLRSSGSYRVKGIEILLNYAFSSFTTWLSWTYTNNDYTFNDLAPMIFPNNLDIRTTISSGISYDNGPLALSLGLSSRSGIPYTPTAAQSPIVGNEINYDLPNSVRLENYLRMDFSADYQFDLGASTKGHVGLSFWNLTNNNNILNRYFEIENSEFVQIDQKALEMTPNLIFRVTF